MRGEAVWKIGTPSGFSTDTRLPFVGIWEEKEERDDGISAGGDSIGKLIVVLCIWPVFCLKLRGIHLKAISLCLHKNADPRCLATNHLVLAMIQTTVVTAAAAAAHESSNKSSNGGLRSAHHHQLLTLFHSFHPSRSILLPPLFSCVASD